MTTASLAKPTTGAPQGRREMAFALEIILILCVFFLPIPSLLIDLGLALSIALSVLILMVALWIEKPLEFSSFPTVLLVATLLRLSLNIATTRLILSHGGEGVTAAGYVIGGFARLVMSGDFVIGLIVFAILITVNFLVITKGATRIAEVGARFTLDAIPGKQMAIDADLSAGLIDDKAAQRRRRELEEESAFTARWTAPRSSSAATPSRASSSWPSTSSVASSSARRATACRSRARRTCSRSCPSATGSCRRSPH